LTRAYFTAATCAISLFKPLSVNTPSEFFCKNNFNKKLVYNKCLKFNYNYKFNSISSLSSSNINFTSKEVTLWNKQLGVSSMNKNSRLTNMERDLIQLTPIIRSILIGLILSDG
jgi:hypothetical protein